MQRRLIAAELADKMPHLLTMLHQEMDEAKDIFLKQQRRIKEVGRPLTDRNTPPVAGQLRFCKEIKEKISHSIKNFKDLNHPICVGASGEQIVEKYKGSRINMF